MTASRSVLAALFVVFVAAAAFGQAWVDIEKAQPLKIESLGEPVRSMRYSGNFLIPKPEQKGWWFVLCYNPQRRNSLPCQFYVVDLDTHKVTMEKRMPAGAAMTTIGTPGVTGKDGKFYMPFLGAPLGMWSFEPRDGSIQWLPSDVEELLFSYSMSVAPGDGKIYVGSASAIAVMVEYDPATGKYRNLGELVGHHTRPRYIWTIAAADDYVYCVAGKNPWFLVAYERATGKVNVLLTEKIDYMECGGSGDTCYASVRFLPEAGKPPVGKYYRLQGGRAIEFDPTKEPRPKAVVPLTAPKPEVLTDLEAPDSNGNAQVWWRFPGKDWEFADLTGIQTTPYKIDVLCPMQDGRLFGGARDYQDCFICDPKTGKFTILGKPPVSFGTTERIGDQIYLLGYPSTYMLQYDPGRPWTVGKSTPAWKAPDITVAASNPRECHRWNDILPTHHIRASAIGADGFIYFGAHAERNAVGGGFGWWDPVNRKAGGLREPFLVQDCAGMAAARDGKCIVYSSFPVNDPMNQIPTPAEGRLYVLDTTSRKIVDDFVPMPGMKNCGEIAALGDRVFGIGTAEGRKLFYVVDLKQRKVVFSQPVASGFFPTMGPDRKLYLFIDKALVRVDPETLAATVLGAVDGPGGISFLNGDIYLAGRTELRRIAGFENLK